MTEAELLAQATNNLKRAVKANMIKRECRVNYDNWELAIKKAASLTRDYF
jgi:hypothetical protein